jgi:hypothetical protein
VLNPYYINGEHIMLVAFGLIPLVSFKLFRSVGSRLGGPLHLIQYGLAVWLSRVTLHLSRRRVLLTVR